MNLNNLFFTIFYPQYLGSQISGPKYGCVSVLQL